MFVPPPRGIKMNEKEIYRSEVRKLDDFIRSWLPTLRKEFGNCDEMRRQNRIERDHLNTMSIEKLEEAECLDFLRDLEEKHESTGCNTGLYYLLWHLIELNKPRYFLECGTGVSTHLIARAMKEFCYDKHDGDIRLVSMEDSPEWYKTAMKHPVEHDFVDIVLSDVEKFDLITFSCSSYKDIPYYPYDHVFVDGPPQAHSVNIDLLRVIENGPHPVLGIIDQRLKTVLFFYLLYGKNYIKRFGTTFIFGPANKDTLFHDEDDKISWKADAIANERLASILLPHIESGITFK